MGQYAFGQSYPSVVLDFQTKRSGIINRLEYTSFLNCVHVFCQTTLCPHIDLVIIGLLIKFKSINDAFSIFYNKTIVITGTLSRPRSEIKELLESLGSKVTDSVTNKTDILITGDNPGSKYNKAKELNINIMSEEELYKHI